MKSCGRCGALVAPAEAEGCWYCDAVLCFDCWDLVGHCGHTEADRINEAAATGNRLPFFSHMDAQRDEDSVEIRFQ